MALDELVWAVDGRVLADLRLVVTEMVTTFIHAGTGAPLAVRIETLSPTHVRGEVTEESEAPGTPIPEARPILDELTSRWGVGPDPRRMWFEIELA